MTRLADVLVIQAVRAWLSSDPAAHSGWLGALRNPQIGRVLDRIHRQPDGDWTVSTLAAVAGMSRSGFAARFSELVGETPMRFVTRVRMSAAVGILREGSAIVGELASRFGYSSEAAFSRAFKRAVGVPPGAVRRRAGARLGV